MPPNRITGPFQISPLGVHCTCRNAFRESTFNQLRLEGMIEYFSECSLISAEKIVETTKKDSLPSIPSVPRGFLRMIDSLYIHLDS